jgi:hypothetical protein
LRFSALVACSVILGVSAASIALAGPAMTQPFGEVCSADSVRTNPWAVSFDSPGAIRPPAGRLRLDVGDTQPAAVRRAVPVEYSEAYRVRAKIHKIASFATLPLFVANVVVGQKLYNNTNESDSLKGTHVALSATTGVLFGVNTITGAWNLWESRKDPNNRKRRLTHGLLMMAADAGFLATALLAPHGENRSGTNSVDSSGRSTHRAVAFGSMGVATVSYLIMLLGRD